MTCNWTTHLQSQRKWNSRLCSSSLCYWVFWHPWAWYSLIRTQKLNLIIFQLNFSQISILVILCVHVDEKSGYIYTVSQKKGASLSFALGLSNVNWFQWKLAEIHNKNEHKVPTSLPCTTLGNSKSLIEHSTQ